jgi:anti-anti-sigma factor
LDVVGRKTMSETAQSSRRPLLIELGGDIDLANAAALGDALCEALDRTRSEMVVDLSAVPFIDSRGIAMMARVHEHATRRECSVTWRGLQEWPARVVAITGLDAVLFIEK